MLFDIVDLEKISVLTILIVMFVSFILGSLLCVLCIFTHRKTGYDRSFCITLMILPILVSVIIMLVSNDLARAFSLAGLFTLVRFRTQISDTKDIAYILTTVAIGLSCGLGFLTYAIIITLFISVILFFMNILRLDQEKETHAKLKILIPESLNYTNAFDDVFDKYLITFQLEKVKTTDFGTMFELIYIINFKKNIDQKEFIDQLRVKNGNLNIVLTTEYISRVSD